MAGIVWVEEYQNKILCQSLCWLFFSHSSPLAVATPSVTKPHDPISRSSHCWTSPVGVSGNPLHSAPYAIWRWRPGMDRNAILRQRFTMVGKHGVLDRHNDGIRKSNIGWLSPLSKVCMFPFMACERCHIWYCASGQKSPVVDLNRCKKFFNRNDQFFEDLLSVTQKRQTSTSGCCCKMLCKMLVEKL